MKRQEVYENLFGARALFIAGLVMMPALFFNPDLRFRIFQFLFFWLLAWLSGKKNNPVFTILVILGIVGVNLIIPYGRVLFSVGVFKITEGGLALGIHRAVTLEGLIMLSRFTIRRDLKIPGFFGELLGESFRIFAEITNRKQRITRKNFIADIDRLMLELSGDDAIPAAPQTNPGTKPRTKPAGFVILALVVVLAWLPWIVLSADH